MSVTIKSRSLSFSAAADEYTGVVHCRSISLQTSGGAAGDQLVITDSAGDTLVNYRTNGVQDDAEFLFGEHFACRGLKMLTFPTGTSQVLVLLR
jgi:hypothetical protein